MHLHLIFIIEAHLNCVMFETLKRNFSNILYKKKEDCLKKNALCIAVTFLLVFGRLQLFKYKVKMKKYYNLLDLMT